MSTTILQDPLDKVTGAAKYAGDHYLPDMLHLQIRFSDRPHARITSINIKKAAQMPGVAAVFTAKDVPHNRYGLMVEDQPVLCDETVRFIGDQVAVVVAATPQQAKSAAAQIVIRYRDLQVITSPEQALAADAPQIHAEYEGNIAASIRLRKGNIKTALENPYIVYENEYSTPMQEHSFLEPEAGIAYVDEEGILVVRTAGQSVFDDQRQIATALGIPPSQVNVVYGPIGGAFGGREDLSVQIVLALAAWKLKKPVRACWSRSESICGHNKRHAMKIKHRWGAKKNGRITAAEVNILVDAGAYMYTSGSVLECLHSICVGPYDIPNVSLDGKAVFTNNLPGGAFRGYGTPQTAFAAELQMDHLAELLGIDPITIREINCLKDNAYLPTKSPLHGKSSLPELIEKCTKKSNCKKTEHGWELPQLEQEAGKRKGFGFALGMKATGYGYGAQEGGQAKVILHGGSKITHVDVYVSAADVGQGSNIVLITLAAQALGVPHDLIEIHPSDTRSSTDTGATAASRVTFMAGNAVKLAAEKAQLAWQDETRPAVGEAGWETPPTTTPNPLTGACIDNVSYSFAAQGVFISVDMQTGQITVDRVVALQDVGRAILPEKIEGQMTGAMIQALGWTLVEDFVMSGGKVISDSFSKYLIPTAMDIPSTFECTMIKNPDPNGPYGARGVGEVPFVPTAPAILSAIKDATGLWFSHIPIKPEDLIGKFSDKS